MNSGETVACVAIVPPSPAPSRADGIVKRTGSGSKPIKKHWSDPLKRSADAALLKPGLWWKKNCAWIGAPNRFPGWLQGNSDAQVSPEWVYHYIYADKGSGGDLHKHLRCQKKRPKRYGSRARRGKIPNQVSIAQRPAVVAQRKRVGDWEADTSIGKGKRQALTLRDTRRGASPWLIACLALPD